MDAAALADAVVFGPRHHYLVSCPDGLHQQLAQQVVSLSQGKGLERVIAIAPDEVSNAEVWVPCEEFEAAQLSGNRSYYKWISRKDPELVVACASPLADVGSYVEFLTGHPVARSIFLADVRLGLLFQTIANEPTHRVWGPPFWETLRIIELDAPDSTSATSTG